MQVGITYASHYILEPLQPCILEYVTFIFTILAFFCASLIQEIFTNALSFTKIFLCIHSESNRTN